jgi:hypothetical protein
MAMSNLYKGACEHGNEWTFHASGEEFYFRLLEFCQGRYYATMLQK